MRFAVIALSTAAFVATDDGRRRDEQCVQDRPRRLVVRAGENAHVYQPLAVAAQALRAPPAAASYPLAALETVGGGS